jgi:hypothetical protein
MEPPSTAFVALFFSLASMAISANARFTAMQWTPAHATFYGDETAAETLGTLHLQFGTA